MKHLEMEEVLALARRGERHPHMDECMFCAEEFAMAIELLDFETDMTSATAAGSDRELPVSVVSAYRLAAQSGETGNPMFKLRRTWYFDEDSAILRVIEDTERQTLTGFFISDRKELRSAGIRFEGLEGDFVPDRNGMFRIGPAAIDIEPMKVHLIRNI